MRPIAHVDRDADGNWREPHDLVEHLHGVEELAAGFAAPFGAADWARLAGRWHDLGKFRNRFQGYIRKVSGLETLSGRRTVSSPRPPEAPTLGSR